MKTLKISALTVLAALLVATPALAAQKAYDASPIAANATVFLQRAPTITPSVQPSPGLINEGIWILEDDSAGTITANQWQWGNNAATTTNVTGFMMANPGAYIFTRGIGTTSAAAGQTASGDTAAGTGQIDWGVLTGFSGTGANFCRSTPPFVCTFAQRIEDGSTGSVLNSTTYDVGTWNFDANGDFDSFPFIQQTSTGGVANIRYQLVGKFVGASLPALPLVGLGALALAFGVVGVRSVMKKK